jgi:exosortase/archaeosortase family protein
MRYRYVLYFLLCSAALFGLFYFHESPFYALNAWQSRWTDSLVEYLLPNLGLHAVWENGTIRFANGAWLELTDDCNGMALFFILAAAVVAYPEAGWKEKTAGIIGGYGIVSIANIARIAGVSMVMDQDAGAYPWIHNIVGRYGTGVLLLLLYLIFVTRQKRYRSVRRKER